MFLGTPLLLGSLFGILAGLALTVLLMAHIVGEEKMLGRELEGYREYTKNARYRLFPLLW
jgi:protein-S-isoprenylcysteine O-methyltransferase Ste14